MFAAENGRQGLDWLKKAAKQDFVDAIYELAKVR
jgi:hypothetical protein